MKPSIILVAPQMGENIGSAARAMKNFSITDLRIIAPRDGWPNERAESMAVGAVDIVHEAKIYESLEDGIRDIEYLYATTSVPRDMNKDYVISSQLIGDYPVDAKVGIMFGRENCGLNNQEISYANKIITIDTDINFSSLNIAQAIAIICYELFTPQQRLDLENSQQLATKEEISYFFDHLFIELSRKDFFKVPEKRKYMMQNISNIFNRINKLSKNELQTLRGVVSSLSK